MRKRHASVWRQLYDDPSKALDLELRSHLLIQLQALIRQRHEVGQDLATLIDKRELAAVEQGQLHKLKLDTLVRIAARLGCDIQLELSSTRS